MNFLNFKFIGLFAVCHLLYSCANFNPIVESATKWRLYKNSYYDKYGHYTQVEKLPLPYICIKNKKLPLYRQSSYPDVGITKNALDNLTNSSKIDSFYIAKKGEKIRNSKNDFMSYLNSKNSSIDKRNYVISKWYSRDNNLIVVMLEID